MSASNKKKLRKELDAAKLTEKQLAAQKEARSTRLYTVCFVVLMAAILIAAVFIAIRQTVVNSGIRERSTTALTVGDHELNSAELNYFFITAVNNFYSQYGSYASMFGLDVSTPLDEQVIDEETGRTWADDFLDSAKENAQAVYAICDAAEAAGYSLTEDDTAAIESELSNLELYAAVYGYDSTKTYLKAIYGNGATEEGYRAYLEATTLASSYYSAYGESLSYTDEDLRAVDSEDYSAYSSFSFHTYYLAASRFLEGGTTDADGNTTYSDEETAASVAAAEEAAQALTDEEITSVEELDEAIAALAINTETTASSTAYDGTLYSNISSIYADWLADESREAGDKAYFASTSTSTAEDGTETTTNGYYVVYYLGSNDNAFALANVRHILVAFEGGTTDDSGNTTYSDEEKTAAKDAAEDLLEQWKSGDATEDSFAALANEHSDDGDGTTGGLYENVYPGQMVTNFNDWCFDESRQTGDTDVVETEYGYHVMYYVGDSDMTYRDYLIDSELRSADLEAWYNEQVAAVTVSEVNSKYISTGLVLSAS